jgi:Predicted pPIWI-associating nuclease
MKCRWYAPVPKTNGPTRDQRAKYAVQGGLPDEALSELRDQILDIRKDVLKWFEKLNSFTHLRPRTTITKAKKIEELAANILSVFSGLLQPIFFLPNRNLRSARVTFRGCESLSCHVWLLRRAR